MQGFTDPIDAAVSRAAAAAWLRTGVVTAFGSDITATIDGASVTGIKRNAAYTTPAASDVALFAVVRGTTAVQYVAICKII